MMRKYYAIIAAAGKGCRFGSAVPKQFLELATKPVLLYSLEAFQASAYKPKIIVAIDPSYTELWAKLCHEHNITIPHEVVCGGATRAETVKKALSYIKDDHGVVSIHDGARPLISPGLITELYKAMDEVEAVIPAVNPLETVFTQTDHHELSNWAKKNTYLAQTPQCFMLRVIKQVYAEGGAEDLRNEDEASLVLGNKVAIKILRGDRNNIKITSRSDLRIAETLLKEKMVLRA